MFSKSGWQAERSESQRKAHHNFNGSVHLQELSNDKAAAEAELNGKLGTLRYLESIKAREAARAAAAAAAAPAAPGVGAEDPNGGTAEDAPAQPESGGQQQQDGSSGLAGAAGTAGTAATAPASAAAAADPSSRKVPSAALVAAAAGSGRGAGPAVEADICPVCHDELGQEMVSPHCLHAGSHVPVCLACRAKCHACHSTLGREMVVPTPLWTTLLSTELAGHAAVRAPRVLQVLHDAAGPPAAQPASGALGGKQVARESKRRCLRLLRAYQMLQERLTPSLPQLRSAFRSSSLYSAAGALQLALCWSSSRPAVTPNRRVCRRCVALCSPAGALHAPPAARPPRCLTWSTLMHGWPPQTRWGRLC